MTLRRRPKKNGRDVVGIPLTDPLHASLYGFPADVVTTIAAMQRLHLSSVGQRTDRELTFSYHERVKVDGGVYCWIEARHCSPARTTTTIIAELEHNRTPTGLGYYGATAVLR